MMFGFRDHKHPIAGQFLRLRDADQRRSAERQSAEPAFAFTITTRGPYDEKQQIGRVTEASGEPPASVRPSNIHALRMLSGFQDNPSSSCTDGINVTASWFCGNADDMDVRRVQKLATCLPCHSAYLAVHGTAVAAPHGSAGSKLCQTLPMLRAQSCETPAPASSALLRHLRLQMRTARQAGVTIRQAAATACEAQAAAGQAAARWDLADALQQLEAVRIQLVVLNDATPAAQRAATAVQKAAAAVQQAATGARQNAASFRVHLAAAETQHRACEQDILAVWQEMTTMKQDHDALKAWAVAALEAATVDGSSPPVTGDADDIRGGGAVQVWTACLRTHFRNRLVQCIPQRQMSVHLGTICQWLCCIMRVLHHVTNGTRTNMTPCKRWILPKSACGDVDPAAYADVNWLPRRRQQMISLRDQLLAAIKQTGDAESAAHAGRVQDLLSLATAFLTGGWRSLVLHRSQTQPETVLGSDSAISAQYQ